MNFFEIVKKTIDIGETLNRIAYMKITIEHKGEEIDVEVFPKWEDTSFQHEFGTQKEGYWYFENVYLNDKDIFEQLSDETISYISKKIVDFS